MSAETHKQREKLRMLHSRNVQCQVTRFSCLSILYNCTVSPSEVFYEVKD